VVAVVVVLLLDLPLPFVFVRRSCPPAAFLSYSSRVVEGELPKIDLSFRFETRPFC